MKNKLVYLLILLGLFLTNRSPAQISDGVKTENPDLSVKPILSFPVKDKKQVLLFASSPHQLAYMLLQSDGTAEFRYAASENQDKTFALDRTGNKAILTFQNGTYSVYESKDRVGIKIQSNGKTYDWKGDKAQQKGSLKNIVPGDYSNVAPVFKVQGFSDRYEAKVCIKDPQAVFSAGWVAVYDKKNGKELLKTRSEDLAADFVDEEVEANVHERPYGKQNVLIYEDFNFDGQKDLAISDGNHSCYGGPSYRIYLADANGFSFSKGFTKLVQDYCGLFGVNDEDQTLSTMTKSGCCWHQFSTFKVKDNKPYPLKIIEEDASGMSVTVDYKVSERKNGKMIDRYYQKLDKAAFTNEDGTYADNLMTAYTFKNGKKMYLFYVSELEKNYYAFTDAQGRIELLYDGEIRKNTKDYCAEFENKGVTYKIYRDRLEVATDDKTYTLKPVNKEGGIGAFLK